MVLQVAEQWEQFFTAAGISSAESKTYASTFVTNRIMETMLPTLSKDYLIDLGVTIIGDILAISSNMPKVSLNHPLRLPQQPSLAQFPQCPPESFNKQPPIRPAEISLDMTNQQFRKFKIDWGVFKQLIAIRPSQIAAQLYNL